MRQIVQPPTSVYPHHDDWTLMEQRFFPRYLAQSETFFALANGYLGMRGVFNAGHPAAENGTFINGFFEHRPLFYGEKGFGFPKTSEAMLNVTDGKVIQLYVDGDLFDLTQADFIEFKRYLDLRSATLNQEMVWEMPSGKRIAVKSTRLVFFGRRHTAAVSYEVTVLDADARLTLVSALITPEGAQVEEENDPRRAQGFQGRVLHPVTQRVDGYRGMLCHGTRASKLNLACGMDHVVETECEYSHDTKCSEDNAAIVFSVDAKANRPFRLVKFLGYHSAGADIPVRELCFSVELTLDRALRRGFDRLLSDQREYMEDFWHRSDVRISGGPTEVQLVLRWNLFQLLQTSARGEGAGIPAKGLTGEAYEGHHFWDAEIYVLPFLIYTAPRCARSVLKYRYGMLDQARERARELGHKGAMFPWRTITGQESSAYYAAGTAQYHINADIAYALKKYVAATNDQQFLLEYGAEILVETARLWFDLGFYSETHDGGFCINGVTGPDEYTTVVNNNYFTNLMAQENLCYAAAVIEAMQQDHPDEYGELVERTGLQFAEVYDWKDAAQQMYLPYDRKLGIHPQDEDFLEKEAWDFDGTPDSKYPLLLHFHPLNVYRHQVIKQADTVLAMFLLGNKFSAEEKKRNFDYYDPLTTGDSSLSVCVQSIVAAEIGYLDKALEYFMFAVAMDLGDVAGNVKDGAHIASTGGTWMAAVYGFGGFRDYDGEFSFHPRLPKDWDRLRFPLTIQGNLLEVDITHDNTTYTLSEGEGLMFRHQKQQVELRGSEPVSVTNRPPPSP